MCEQMFSLGGIPSSKGRGEPDPVERENAPESAAEICERIAKNFPLGRSGSIVHALGVMFETGDANPLYKVWSKDPYSKIDLS